MKISSQNRHKNLTINLAFSRLYEFSIRSLKMRRNKPFIMTYNGIAVW